MSWLSSAVKSTPKPNAWNAGPAAGAGAGLGWAGMQTGLADAASGGALSSTAATGAAGYAAYNALTPTQRTQLGPAAVSGWSSLGPAQQRMLIGAGVGAVAGGGVPGVTEAAALTGAGLANYAPSFGSGSNSNGNNNNGNNGTGVSNADWDRLNTRIKGQQYTSPLWDPDGRSINGVNIPNYVNGRDGILEDYRQMSEEGKSPGLSNWGNAAYNRSRADQGYAIEDARGQAMQDAGAGMNTLAMQGGLESGAAENMLRNASQNANRSRTDLYRQGSMDRMGIDVADASRKDQMRTQGLAGGMDVARYDTDVQNINSQNAINDMNKRMEFETGKLGMEGQMRGAQAVSNAYLNGGGNSTNGGMFSGVMNRTGNPQQDIFNMNPITGFQATRQNVGNFWNSGGSF